MSSQSGRACVAALEGPSLAARSQEHAQRVPEQEARRAEKKNLSPAAALKHAAVPPLSAHLRAASEAHYRNRGPPWHPAWLMRRYLD